jgi:DNA-binding HxlR family transcriptional regulator
VLTQRLRQFDRGGLIVRTYHAEVPHGSDTRSANSAAASPPLFAHLAEWSANLDKVDRARADHDSGAARR